MFLDSEFLIKGLNVSIGDLQKHTTTHDYAPEQPPSQPQKPHTSKQRNSTTQQAHSLHNFTTPKARTPAGNKPIGRQSSSEHQLWT